MTIETKYNLGDEVWMMLGGKARQGIISGIAFYRLGHTLSSYYYNVQIGASHGSFNEPDLFFTKEELIKSL